MMITDRFGQCLAVNDIALRLLGHRRSSVLQGTLDTLFTIQGTTTAGSFRARLSHDEHLDAEVRMVQGGGMSVRIRLRADDLERGLRLITLSRIHDRPAKEPPLWRGSGTRALVDELFFLPWGDEDTDYHALFQHSPYGICILQNDRIAVVNPTFCKLIGYRSADEVLGREIREFLDDGSRMFFALLQQRVFRGEAIPTRFETRMIRQGGSTIDVETSFAMIWYKGAPALNLTVGDITDRKELEKRLTDSESLLRNVINSMVDALVITDLQGKVLDVNDEFQRFTGFSRREAFAAEIPYPWVPEENLSSFMSWLEKLREHNVLRDFDITWLRKNGERVAVSLNTTLLRNAAGEPVLMVNIARDISERQASREELSRQLQRLQVLYDLSSALTESLDPTEIARKTCQEVVKVVPADSFSIELYEESKNEVRQLHSMDLHHGKRVELPPRPGSLAVDKSQANGRVILSRRPLMELMDYTHRPPEKAHLAQEWTASSVLSVPIISKQKTIGVLSVCCYRPQAYSNEHLTLLQSIAHLAGIAIEKAQLYQETIKKSIEIEARNKELDDFTYVVSHDLKEPLISVQGYAKMIRHEYHMQFDSKGKEYLQAVVDSCSHMKRLIDDLLMLSRISKLAEKRTRVELGVLVAGVLEELRFSIRERNAEIVVQKNMPVVLGVDTHLRIVFRNLIANALKFCDKSVPRIEISASASQEATTVSVRDNGIGIEEAHFDKIFLIFQRLHRKEEFEGVGAGLTIVRKIVESQGGRIWVDSNVGEGSTFRFTIPTG
jgi:PAS domain S-box-containing protein